MKLKIATQFLIYLIPLYLKCKMKAFDLKGKNILITGSTSGIGFEMAKEFNNMKVFLNLLGRDQEKLDDLKKKLDKKSNVNLIKGNLNNDLNKIVSKIENKLDGIVFNAGIVDYKPLKFLDEDDFLKLFKINYFSSIFLLKNLIKLKKVNNESSIVFISSLSSSIGIPGTLAYSASKASIDSSVKVLANELSKNKIRVNSIAPGIIQTPLLKNDIFNKEKYIDEKEKYPLGLGMPIDVVYSTQFLLSDASRWITGTVLDLNGGYKLE